MTQIIVKNRERYANVKGNFLTGDADCLICDDHPFELEILKMTQDEGGDNQVVISNIEEYFEIVMTHMKKVHGETMDRNGVKCYLGDPKEFKIQLDPHVGDYFMTIYYKIWKRKYGNENRKR